MTTVRIFSDQRMTLHDPGPGHPERPERLRALLDWLESAPQTVEACSPAPATFEQICRVHAEDHVERIKGFAGKHARLDPDTAVSPESVEAALLAAGAAIQCVEHAVQPKTDSSTSSGRAFALVRPPGHHASGNRAMGFCLFNNIAIAAAHAIEQLGCRRVLIVDWDVHHGNGTQDIFYDRRDVFFFSSHQWPLYPGTGDVEETGQGEGIGYTFNAPLPAGTDDCSMLALYRQLLPLIADAIRPDLVLVSAGFDAHRDDPIGGMSLTAGGFAALCQVVREIADRHAHGRLALVLEGGYDLSALVECVSACVDVLAGAEAASAVPTGKPSRAVERLIDFAKRKIEALDSF